MASIMAAPGQGQGHLMRQDFDFFLVVDFEATCVKDGRIYPQEIIEFPSVLVDAVTGGIESAFRRGTKISITGSLPPPPPSKTQQQPHTSPCSGSSVLTPTIQQLQPPPQPHVISTCGGGSSVACTCYCRVATRGCVVSVLGPMQGKCFFGCGNWTPAMGAACPYFVWTN